MDEETKEILTELVGRLQDLEGAIARNENIKVERVVEVKEATKALVDFLANPAGDRNTRIDSPETLKMMMRWRLLQKRGIKIAGEVADMFSALMWSVNGGESRKEAVDVLKQVSEPKSNIVLGGPEAGEVE